MSKFTIISGGIKLAGKVRTVGEEVDLNPEEADRINAKGDFLEASEVIAAKAKAKADSEKAIAKAEAEAKAKQEAELKKAKADGEKGGKS